MAAVQRSSLCDFRSRARMYDPGMGRFLEQDPMGFGGGDTNLYGYVANDPVNSMDPSGKLFIADDAAGVVVGIAAVGVVVGITSGVVNYYSTGSLKSAFDAAGSGFVSGVLSAGAAVLTVASGGTPFLAVGAATSIDLGFGFLTAPTSTPNGSGADFANGVKAIGNQNKTVCP